MAATKSDAMDEARQAAEGGLSEQFLERLAPHEPIGAYQHNLTGEDNGDAHIKRQIMGREVVVAITAGKLVDFCAATREGWAQGDTALP